MIQSLRKLPHFKGIDSEQIGNLITRGLIRRHSYHKGVTVHEQNTICDGMDIVHSGKLIAYSLSSNGSETIVFEFKEDSIIGANLLFGNQNKYPMNIYCTEDTVVYHISKIAIMELLRNYSFVIPFIQSLSLNSQGMNQKIAMYTQKSLRQNLIDYFTALSKSQNTKTIRLPVSKKQLSDYFGVQRPSLFRELKRMKEDGLVSINNRSITIHF